MTIIDEARRRLIDAVSRRITPALDSLSLGFVGASGNELPITIEELPNGQLLLTDGGEPWSDLMVDGFCGAKPTDPQLLRLKKIAELYRVSWHRERRSFVIATDMTGLADAAMRLTMASIALDSWRSLGGERPRVVVQRRIVSDTAALAKTVGWSVRRRFNLDGKETGHSWPVPLLLEGEGDKKRVAIRFEHGTPEDIVERTFAMVFDTRTPAVIAVTPKVAEELGSEMAFKAGRIEFVPRKLHGTPEEILERAGKLRAA